MKRLFVMCSVLLSCCSTATSNYWPPAEAPMAVSAPSSQCHPEEFFPDRKVRPAFYQYGSPEFGKFRTCIYDEGLRSEAGPRPASIADFPKIGTCYSTRIRWIGDRLGGGNPKSGSAVSFENGIELVSYEPVAGVIRSRVGDAATVCVNELPPDCLASDLRGIVYRTYNLRIGESWRMSNSQHGCGGP